MMRMAFMLLLLALASHAALAQVDSACDSTLTRLQAEYQELEGENTRLEQELATIRHGSENILRLTEERSALQHQVARLTRQVADLEQQNLDLRNERSQRWFLIGAGVLAGGILIGLIIPRLRPGRRKTAWNSL